MIGILRFISSQCLIGLGFFSFKIFQELGEYLLDLFLDFHFKRPVIFFGDLEHIVPKNLYQYKDYHLVYQLIYTVRK